MCKWCEQHAEDPPYVEVDPMERRDVEMPAWDADFFRVDQSTLFEIVLAANFLEIRPLMDLACKVIADMIKACTLEGEEDLVGEDDRGDSRHVRHRQRLHSRGGRADAPPERLARGMSASPSSLFLSLVEINLPEISFTSASKHLSGLVSRAPYPLLSIRSSTYSSTAQHLFRCFINSSLY